MSSFLHKIGSVLHKAAPFAGMIPGVGTLAGGVIGAAGGALDGGGWKGALKGGAMGASGGLARKVGGALASKMGGGAAGSFLGKVGSVMNKGGIAGKVGGAIKDTYAPGGKLDLGKIIGTGGAISSMVGQNKQRKSAEKYNNASIDQRNRLMESIMAPQNYNLPQITPNVGGY